MFLKAEKKTFSAFLFIMNQLKTKITRIEEEWLETLFSYNRKLFLKVGMPSHNENHHLRVWSYVKKILKLLNNDKHFSEDELECLIVATFFHDMGMVYTMDVSHGLEGRRLCENFFRKGNFQRPARWEETLKMIEMHDDKEYKNKTENYSLLSVLSIADDLDAFGLTGAVRYAEIYLLRGMLIEQLAETVIKNAQKRFAHLHKKFKDYPVFIGNQEKRYKNLINFYQDTEKYLPVIHNIQNNLRHNDQVKLTDLLKPADKPIIKQFQIQLKKELHEFN